MSDCPDENVLVDYVRGGLSQRGRESVDEHVDTCARCRVALAGLARRVSHQQSLEVDTQPEDRHPLPGTELAERFRIIDFLGVGAMGAVYEAEDVTLGERIALKVLAPHIAERPDVLEYLRREISLGRRVSHPNVCPVYDLGISGKHHFITMKLVVGKTLDQLLEDGLLPHARVEKILKQLAGALAAAHACGVVHRDLKAANVMVDGNDHVWVMDFGLARDIERDPSFSGPVGTPAYWAPEQSLGDPATPVSDVYSFGVIACRLFTGKLPRRHRERTSYKEVAPRWRSLVERCLAERMVDRPAGGAALLNEIALIDQRPQRRLLVTGVVAVALLASALTFALARRDPSSSPVPNVEQPPLVVAPVAPVNVPDAATALEVVGVEPTTVPTATVINPKVSVIDAGKPVPRPIKRPKEDPLPIFE